MSESPPDAMPQRPAGEEPREFTRQVNGVTIVGFEWEGEGAPVLLAHATGFHARVWDEVVRRIPGRRVIALDLRGHGRSSKPVPPYSWHFFGQDVALLLDDLDLSHVIGVGHSMGGHTIADAAILRPERFDALVLVDPTIFAIEPNATRNGNAFDFVAKRRNQWSTPEEMIERFAPRFPFNVWQPEALRDYAVHGLLPAPDGASDGGTGALVLACPPLVEAAVLAGRDSEGADILPILDRITMPVRVLRARAPEPGETPAPFTASPTAPDLATRLPDAVDVYLPHLSHFIPMEAPDLVARHIIQATDAVS
ncbi:MAG: alpha/beta hydrolase [Chloroflexi bacterium]|nr:alpha/beta hydrolase [Chloroflexota bacterium]